MTTTTTPSTQTLTADITSPVAGVGDPQPTVTSPVVDGASAPVADPNAQTATTTPDPAKPNGTDADPAKTQQDWAIRRINEITAKRYAAEREAEAAKAEVAAEKAKNIELLARISKTPSTDPATGTPPANPAATEDEIERRATEKATLIAQANEFNKACNTVASKGKEEFKDWDSALNNLTLVGALGKDVPPTFLETAIELKNPEKILHHLGNNMDDAARIAKLPPAKMAMEMARLEAQLNTPVAPAPLPPISGAPAPVTPIGGAAKPGEKDIFDPTITTEEYFELRNKQIQAKRDRYKRA